MAKNCNGCKHYIFKKCGKGHIFSLMFPINCKHFDKPEPYTERFTKCDKCEYLKECRESGQLIEITTLCDSHEHYTSGIGSFCKKDSEV